MTAKDIKIGQLLELLNILGRALCEDDSVLPEFKEVYEALKKELAI